MWIIFLTNQPGEFGHMGSHPALYILGIYWETNAHKTENIMWFCPKMCDTSYSVKEGSNDTSTSLHVSICPENHMLDHQVAVLYFWWFVETSTTLLTERQRKCSFGLQKMEDAGYQFYDQFFFFGAWGFRRIGASSSSNIIDLFVVKHLFWGTFISGTPQFRF